MAVINQLVTIEKANALAIFSSPGAIDPILERIRKEIDAFEPNVSTKRGRDDIASIAYRVAQSKTYLDGVGKALVDELKDVPKKVDASRKKVRDTLDAWRDEVRRPLTEWEDVEAARVSKHKGTIARLTEIATAPNAGCPIDTTAAQFSEKIAAIGKIELGAACEEFETKYALGVGNALKALHAAMEAATRREAEAAELAALRAAQAAREKAETEAAALRQEAKRQADERAEAERRESNTKHRAKINREARQALDVLLQREIASGNSEATTLATKVVEAIVKGEVPHVAISY